MTIEKGIGVNPMPLGMSRLSAMPAGVKRRSEPRKPSSGARNSGQAMLWQALPARDVC